MAGPGESGEHGPWGGRFSPSLGRPSIARLVPWVLVASALAVYLGALDGALLDDAYIYLRYVDVLVEHGDWGWFPGQRGNAVTSAPNLLLLGGLTVLVGDPVRAAVMSGVLAYLALLALLQALSRRATGSPWTGRGAWAVAVANPFLVSTIGLETLWFLAGLVGMIVCLQADRDRAFGMVAALTTLVRTDTVVLFGLLLLVEVPRRRWWRAAVPFAVPVALWHVGLWLVLGSFVPDTFFIKQMQGASWGATLANGLGTYFDRLPVETLASLAPWLAALGVLWSRPGATNGATAVVRRAALVGLGHFAAYVLLGVAPYPWYYAPLVFAGTVAGAFAAGRLLSGTPPTSGPPRRALALLVLVPLLAPILATAVHFVTFGPRPGEMPIHNNGATVAQYRAAGEALRDIVGDDGVLMLGEIGILGFTCECWLYDGFSDRRVIARFVREASSRYTATAPLYRLNFAFFDPGSAEYPEPRYRLEDARLAAEGSGRIIARWPLDSRWSVEPGQLTLRELAQAQAPGS